MRLGRNRNSTRGRSDPPRRNRCRTLRWHRRFDYPGGGRSLFVAFSRSEEHTSELQSPVQLPTLSLHDALPIFGSVADYLADKFGTQGSPISLSTACASGATAIQLGVEAIRRGETDAALCVGTDGSITPEAVVRFSLLSALSTSNDVPQAAAKPFSKNRDGFVMAEGAGALVLESYDAAKARGARILGVVEGCGEMTDAFHRTRSSPDGKPIIGCVANAIGDAGLTPNDIDYVNAHGTSTPENDKMEYFGCANVFGERIKT